jgi:hypothetical protein
MVVRMGTGGPFSFLPYDVVVAAYLSQFFLWMPSIFTDLSAGYAGWGPVGEEVRNFGDDCPVGDLVPALREYLARALRGLSTTLQTIQ